MSAPLVPSPLDYIGRRAFAFYPPIQHASSNAWILGTGSWSEVQIINSQTGEELWVPRQFIGAVSDHDDALVVGLTQNLEVRNGEIATRSYRRVIEIPLRLDAHIGQRASGPASVVGIRLEPAARTAFQKAPFRVGIVVLFVAGLIALVASTSHMR